MWSSLHPYFFILIKFKRRIKSSHPYISLFGCFNSFYLSFLLIRIKLRINMIVLTSRIFYINRIHNMDKNFPFLHLSFRVLYFFVLFFTIFFVVFFYLFLFFIDQNQTWDNFPRPCVLWSIFFLFRINTSKTKDKCSRPYVFLFGFFTFFCL